MFVLIVLFSWNRETGTGELPRLLGLSVLPVNVLLGLAGFLLLNAAAARTVHFFGGIPYTPLGSLPFGDSSSPPWPPSGA